MDIDTGASLIASTIISGQPFFRNQSNTLEEEALRRLSNPGLSEEGSNLANQTDESVAALESQDALINLLDGLNTQQVRAVLGVGQVDALLAAETVTDDALSPLLESDSSTDSTATNSNSIFPNDFSSFFGTDETLQFLESLGGTVDVLG